MLSKYTIVLIAAAAPVLFIRHAPLRRWFVRPQPYLAAVLALAVFSPVLYWNVAHEWVSFVFQGTRRFSSPPKFALPLYVGQLLVLATPTALLAALTAFGRPQSESAAARLSRRFLLLFFSVPVLVFLCYSLRHETKIIWAGPAFLAALPLLAQHLARGASPAQTKAATWLYYSWFVMIPLSLAGFGAAVYYSALGVPGLPYSASAGRLIGWRSLSAHALNWAYEEQQRTGRLPMIVGMDKHYAAAELGFYTQALAERRDAPAPDVTGRGIVGRDSLMFHFWVPAGDLRGRTALLVSRTKSDLEFSELATTFQSLGPIEEFRAQRNGKPAGRYYLRPAHGFSGSRPSGAEQFFLPE